MTRWFNTLFVAGILFLPACDDGGPEPAPPYTPVDLDAFSANLRGFNLLGKFDVNWSNNGFSEEDFIEISDLGFNFARLPLDYLTYTTWGDWNALVENEVVEIDQALEWGQQYGVHICIGLHRAPGYSVNTSNIPSNQKLNLWQDVTAQDAFIKHWDFFARRYRDVPVDELSFNLINEPSNVDEATYVALMQKAIDKIHAVNPNRVIFVDGLNYGTELIPSLKGKQNVIQALHTYEPFTLTHYKASWVSGSDTWPVPVWPMYDISSYLFGPSKPEYRSSLILQGDFPKDSEVTINVKQVSIQSTLQIKLDDQLIYSKAFTCGPDPGEDWTEIINTQWGYQNISNKDYSVVLPDAGSTLTISNAAGDWMTFNKLALQLGSDTVFILPGNNAWGSMQETYSIGTDGRITDIDGNPLILRNLNTKLEAAKAQGIPVMIQEFGAHNQTPYPVVLSYLGDLVPVFTNHDVGYAMWNLTGSMGIINSSRAGCTYESYRGKQLDRTMMEIMLGN